MILYDSRSWHLQPRERCVSVQNPRERHYLAREPRRHQRAAVLRPVVLEPETALRSAIDVDRHAAVAHRTALDRGRVAGMRLGEADLAPSTVDLDLASSGVSGRRSK